MRVQAIRDGLVYFARPFGMSGSPVFQSSLDPLVLIPQGTVSTEIDEPHMGLIEDGELSPLGERSCTHYSIKGTAVAIPSNTWMQDGYRDVYITHDGPRYSRPHYTFKRRDRYRTYDVSHTGPVILFTDLQDSYRQEFPDYHTSDGISYKDALWNAYKVRPTSNGWIWHKQIVCFWKYPTDDEWRLFNIEQDIEIVYYDIPGSRMMKFRVYPLGGWQYPQRLDTGTVPSTTYESSSFPCTWEGYEHLERRLRMDYTIPSEDRILGDLVRRCANDARVISVNSLELSMELAKIASTFRQTAMLLLGKVNAKNLASAYLSYKYGPRLTVMDLKTLIDETIEEAGRRSDRSYERSRARETLVIPASVDYLGDLVVDYNYKIFHTVITDDWRDGVRSWFNSGLFPTLTNSWDLIPLSFVADWFMSVEDSLNAIDSNTFWSLYRILGVTHSTKRTFRDVTSLFSKTGYPLAGQLDAVFYTRRLASSVHKASFFESSPRTFKNYAELTALVVANR